jgi:hypothetical protein
MFRKFKRIFEFVTIDFQFEEGVYLDVKKCNEPKKKKTGDRLAGGQA